jgi:serine/threonine-protein kinase
MSDLESEAPVRPGDVLAGKYKVLRLLGVGGMGVVVQALHLELDTRVAVKFLLPHSISSPEVAARFVREAKAAVQIKSEHVVQVIDVGRLDDGAPYIVMEFLDGKDLAALIDETAVAVEDAVDYVLQACVAMAEAHRLGIVHRDLKPSNLFLTHGADAFPIVKVLDFGISKVTGGSTTDAALTKTATPMGSPYYMSPEQLRSAKDVDGRTDIWALGVILFELLTRMPPFQAESMPQLVATILSDPPMSLERLAPAVPPGLCAVVARCLEKERDRRYPNVAALAAALAPFAPARSRHSIDRLARSAGGQVARLRDTATAPALPIPAVDAPARLDAVGAGTNTAWIGAHGEKSGVNRRRALLGGGGALLVLVAALLFGFGRSRENREPAASAGTSTVTEEARTAPASVQPGVSAQPMPERPAEVTSAAPSVAPLATLEPASPAPSATAVPSARPRPTATRSQKTAAAAPTTASKPATTAAPKPEPPPSPAATTEPPKPRKSPLAVDLK